MKGQIITFYSYKGGTGRSMALANVACILAGRRDLSTNKGVLMMDWDLEAPGLHRYFYDRLEPRKRAADSRGTGNCDAEPGLIDLFYELDSKIDSLKTREISAGGEMFSEDLARLVLNETDLDKYVIPTKLKGLSLIKAGRFNRNDNNEYPERVNKFNWETLYNKSPHLMRVLAETLSEKYDYVLIDSRTGITDISGVCTMLLPEKLVVVFTPNKQSMSGAVDIVRRATEYRKESDDLRSLIVFPLVSRVESNEPDLRHEWRFGNRVRNIDGYQREFEKVLAEAYGKDDISLNAYFDEIQIQHIPRYAYGEEIAVLEERSDDKFSLKRSYRIFAEKLIEKNLPWENLESAKPAFKTPLISEEFPLAKEVRMPAANTKLLTALLFLIIGLLLATIFLVAAIFIFRPNQPSATLNAGDAVAAISPSPDRPQENAIGRKGLVTTNVNIRSEPNRYAAPVGIHFQGAIVEIMDQAVGTPSDGGDTWYYVRVLENGCDMMNLKGCGNELNGSTGGAAAQGWIIARFIWLEGMANTSGDQKTSFPLAAPLGAVVDMETTAVAIRSLPDSTIGSTLTLIPKGSQINITGCLDYKIRNKGRFGHWCRATYAEYEGWVFDGFVKYNK